MYIDPIQADKEKRLSQGFEFARETSYKATLSRQHTTLPPKAKSYFTHTNTSSVIFHIGPDLQVHSTYT